ncbi:hypothetical protein L6R29_11625 [Myxococcota bacterium]|nr:hypothetical protein [Myxococcota bacterium]
MQRLFFGFFVFGLFHCSVPSNKAECPEGLCPKEQVCDRDRCVKPCQASDSCSADEQCLPVLMTTPYKETLLACDDGQCPLGEVCAITSRGKRCLLYDKSHFDLFRWKTGYNDTWPLVSGKNQMFCRKNCDKTCSLTKQVCERSSDCKTLGKCTPKESACAVTSDADCLLSDLCKDKGFCAEKNGQCVECSSSTNCATNGRCGLINHQCLAETSTHCKNSTLCKATGACVLKDGACVK